MVYMSESSGSSQSSISVSSSACKHIEYFIENGPWTADEFARIAIKTYVDDDNCGMGYALDATIPKFPPAEIVKLVGLLRNPSDKKTADVPHMEVFDAVIIDSNLFKGDMDVCFQYDQWKNLDLERINILIDLGLVEGDILIYGIKTYIGQDKEKLKLLFKFLDQNIGKDDSCD